MASTASYNEARWTRAFLKRHRKLPPSLVVHLYATHFRFEQQHGMFTYDSPMKCFLEAIREQKLPTDLLDVLDEAGVRYYEGCLIVEVHDHRSTQPTLLQRPTFTGFASTSAREAPGASKAELFRIVLAPNPATLWSQLGIQERKDAEKRGAKGGKVWTEEDAVEMEAAILARTAAPLCLSPSIQTTRIANMMQLATASRPHKRKRFCSADDDDDAGEETAKREREERDKLMKIGDEGIGRSRGNAFARLAFIQAHREAQANKAAKEAAALAAGNIAGVPIPGSMGTTIRLGNPAAIASAASTPGPSGSPSVPSKPKKKASTANAGADGDAPALKKLSKKALAAAAAAGLSLDPNDPTLPQDPAEKEAALKERRKLIEAKRKADSKAKAKEKKKAEAAAAAAALASNDLQVGGTPAASTPRINLTWSGA